MHLNQKEMDNGTLAAMLQRYNEYQLPRAKRMLDRVNLGERISDYDILWLKRVYDDSRQAELLIERNPEYTRVFVRAVGLYAEITAKALANEKAGP